MSIHQFGAMSIAATAVLVTSATLDYEIYSPDLFNGTLYLGGWRTAADIGPDQLYTSPANTDHPTPLVWNGPAPYDLYHLNDPSVVREADGTLAMFMTALPNLYGYSVEMQNRNVTGLATSVDDGATWTWQGIVIGQRNGIDSTGAWSPSALADATGISVWYNTGWMDANTGQVMPIRMLKTEMDATDLHILSTVDCINTATGSDVSGENVDVYRATDGTYWMVANDFSPASGNADKIVCYHSPDGINWTPWSTAGATLLAPRGNTVLMTPTITNITGNTMQLAYAEQVGPSATVELATTINLSDRLVFARFIQSNVFGGFSTAPLNVVGQSYTGPVAYLTSQFIYAGTDNVNLTALVPNVFLHGGPGDDALVASSGRNVLDGGSGSNFLSGGTGTDVFFLVGSSGIDTWTTVNGFKTGDEATIWDVTPSMVDLDWHASQGAANARGATLHVSEGVGHWASLTLAGWTPAQAEAATSGFGSIGGRPFLHLAA